MILSAKLIFNSKIRRYCAHCSSLLDELHIQLNGMSDYGDTPRTCHVHINCCNEVDFIKLSDWHFQTLLLNKDSLYKDKYWSNKR